MRLFFDVGNTRIKWCVAGLGDTKSYGSCLSSLDELSKALVGVDSVDSIDVASVSSDVFNNSFARFLNDRFGLQPHFVVSQPEACGVRNGYDDFAELGVDRWVAVVAAANRFNGPVLIVDAGSAVTIDIVGDLKLYKGGYIMPGINLMYRSLIGDTGKIVNLYKDWPADLDLPTSTHQAVNKGMALYVVAAIEKLARELSKEQNCDFKLVLTGGDAESIANLLSLEVILVESLVLDGVELISKEFRA